MLVYTWHYHLACSFFSKITRVGSLKVLILIFICIWISYNHIINIHSNIHRLQSTLTLFDVFPKISQFLHHLCLLGNLLHVCSCVVILLARELYAIDKSIECSLSNFPQAALELLSVIEGENLRSRRIQSVYELWMEKIGPLKYWSTKVQDKYSSSTIIVTPAWFPREPSTWFLS